MTSTDQSSLSYTLRVRVAVLLPMPVGRVTVPSFANIDVSELFHVRGISPKTLSVNVAGSVTSSITAVRSASPSTALLVMASVTEAAPAVFSTKSETVNFACPPSAEPLYQIWMHFEPIEFVFVVVPFSI